jgi:catechol 2,3-dioxygenase-like lactoylglutathione lyase family enzyme
MNVQSLNHINLRVPPNEINGLKDFYCGVIGLTEGWRPPFASRGFWLYAGDSPIVHLVERAPGEPTAAGSGSAVDHVALKCTGLQEAITRLRELNVEFAVSKVPVQGDTQLLLRDPVGMGIELTFSEG